MQFAHFASGNISIILFQLARELLLYIATSAERSKITPVNEAAASILVGILNIHLLFLPSSSFLLKIKIPREIKSIMKCPIIFRHILSF